MRKPLQANLTAASATEPSPSKKARFKSEVDAWLGEAVTLSHLNSPLPVRKADSDPGERENKEGVLSGKNNPNPNGNPIDDPDDVLRGGGGADKDDDEDEDEDEDEDDEDDEAAAAPASCASSSSVSVRLRPDTTSDPSDKTDKPLPVAPPANASSAKEPRELLDPSLRSPYAHGRRGLPPPPPKRASLIPPPDEEARLIGEARAMAAAATAVDAKGEIGVRR